MLTLEVQFKPDNQAQFNIEVQVFSVVGNSHSLSRKAPRLVDIRRQSRKLVFEYPRLHWRPLYKRARECDEPTLLHLKELLCETINELYDNDVAYPVRRDAIFLVKRSKQSANQSYRWDIFLGGWQQCTLRNQAGTAELNKQRKMQLDGIELLFKPLLAHAWRQLHGDHEREPILGQVNYRGVLPVGLQEDAAESIDWKDEMAIRIREKDLL